MKKRVLVLGGRGYYGAQVVALLQGLPSVDVTVGSRRSTLPSERVDLSDPETFATMEGYDLIVNCSDTVTAPPDDAIRYCLEHGLAFFEMGADGPTMERLLACTVPSPLGTVVLGVGIFPGLSTLLACEMVRRNPAAQKVDLAIRISPFSGAGRGNCALMTESLDTPAYYVEAGQRREESTVGASLSVSFLESGEQPANRLSLPDTALIHRATGLPSVSAYFSVAPSWLRHNFRFLAGIIRWAGPFRAFFLWLLRWQLIALRTIFCRKVHSPVELTVLTDRGTPQERSGKITVANGQLGTALGVAAAVSLWGRTERPAPGCVTVADVFEWDEMIREARRLSSEPLRPVWS